MEEENKKTRQIDITTNIGCANMCEFCPQKRIIKEYSKRSDIRFMSLEGFKEMLSKIPKEIKVSFGGYSECFLNKDCIDMILHAHREGYRISVGTTLRNFKIEYIKRLEKINFSVFQIHLADNDNLVKINVDKNYLNILKKVRKSKIRNLDFMVVGEISKKIKEEMGEDFEYADNIQISSKCGEIKHLGLPIPKFRKGRIICSTCTRLDSNTLFPNGDINLCCMDYGLDHVLGNIYEENYEEIINGKKINDIRKRMRVYQDDDLLCRRCDNSKNYYSYKINRLLKQPTLKLLKLMNLIELSVKVKSKFKTIRAKTK